MDTEKESVATDSFFLFLFEGIKNKPYPLESNDRGLDFPKQKINIKAGTPPKIFRIFISIYVSLYISYKK